MNISIPKNKIVEFCERNQIVKFSLFGSVLRDDFGPDSDIDVLVEFDKKHIPSFFKLFDMEDELSNMFLNRKAEIKTAKDLSKYFRNEVVESAKLIYEKR